MMSIEEHEAEEAEPHCCVESEPESLFKGKVTCVRQEDHDGYRNQRSDEEIELTSPEELTEPGTIGKKADTRLHDHTHEGRQDPEEGKLMRVGTEGCENTGYVRALKRVRDLYAKEAETQVE